MMKNLMAGNARIYIVDDEEEMGNISARKVAASLRNAASIGKETALWLMAAPSGFAFYKSFVDQCRSDFLLASLMKRTRIYQFDEYPIGRNSTRFRTTFRNLLETYFIHPLQEVCGQLEQVRLLELEGTEQDRIIAERYANDVLEALYDPHIYVIELKGTGMDGHWGFHGAETPINATPGMHRIAMTSQNIHQQKIDWPQFYKTDADVPKFAYSFSVSAFLKSDFIIDNIPQVEKEFSVLSVYGTNKVLREVPSSAVKIHCNAIAILTSKSASALLEFRRDGHKPEYQLSRSTLDRLRSLWKNPASPDIEKSNIVRMESVLGKLGMTG